MSAASSSTTCTGQHTSNTTHTPLLPHYCGCDHIMMRLFICISLSNLSRFAISPDRLNEDATYVFSSQQLRFIHRDFQSGSSGDKISNDHPSEPCLTSSAHMSSDAFCQHYTANDTGNICYVCTALCHACARVWITLSLRKKFLEIIELRKLSEHPNLDKVPSQMHKISSTALVVEAFVNHVVVSVVHMIRLPLFEVAPRSGSVRFRGTTKWQHLHMAGRSNMASLMYCSSALYLCLGVCLCKCFHAGYSTMAVGVLRGQTCGHAFRQSRS